MDEHRTNVTEASARQSLDAAKAGRARLEREEREALRARRERTRDGGATRVGLALSGGGIRSATFCLGLVRGLAQNRLLRRFDYLSTVSGGGYVGAAIGRLLAAVGIDEGERAIASGDSLLLTWLRRNGRYLTPAGSRDLGSAIATYLRAGIAIHLEIAFFGILLGLLIVAPHVLQAEFSFADDKAWQAWGTAWWPLAAGFWLLCAPGAMASYWPLAESGAVPDHRTVRDTDARARTARLLAGLGAATLLAFVLSRPGFDALLPFGRPGLAVVVTAVLAAAVVRLAFLLARLVRSSAEPAYGAFGRERLHLTASLRRINLATVAMAAFGAFDLLSRSFVAQLDAPSPWWLGGGVGIGSVLFVLVRALAEPLQKMLVSADGPQARWLPQLVNAIGIGIALLLLFAWTALVQTQVFDADPDSVIGRLPPWTCALALLLLVLAWLWRTWRNRDTVNASSMHNFYRARLTRAYLSIGNRQRFAEPARDLVDRDMRSVGASVADVRDGDDVPLHDYRPDLAGGPIHLVSTCLNQTVDDHSGLYNADRKGLCVTVSARGIEVGNDAVHACDETSGSLGRWITVSGAAAAPGAGSYTTTGWALLLFMVGARLGYWLDAAFAGGRAAAKALGAGANATVGWLRDTKQGLLANEALASFGGRRQGWWYLSDGGHFDNTGVYPLLRRELDFIVLADCGADARFEFADIENLIRKARIDFDADIEFYSREEAARLFPGGGTELHVLAPEDMLDNHSVRGVLLARVFYHRSDPARWKLGTLLVVKPNLHDALDRDVLAYARRNPAFPQQSTGDQFFDEAQWESYHRLGEDFGRALTSVWLRRLPGWRVPIERPDTVVPLRPQAFAATASADAQPFWRRGVAATAIGAGLGIGAVGTLLLPAWQALDALKKDRERDADQVVLQKARVNALLDQVTDPVREVIAGRSADVAYGVAQKLAQMYDADRAYPDDARLRYVDRLVADAQKACGVVASRCPDQPPPHELMCDAVCDRERSNGPDPYWGYHPTVEFEWRKNRVVAFTIDRLVDAGLGGFAYRGDLVATRQATPPSTVPQVPATVPSADTPPLAPAPTAPATTTDTTLASCRDGGDRADDPVVLYVQIYDEQMRDELGAMYAAIATATPQAKGYVRVPGVENVTQTANLRGTRAPWLWRNPTLLLHRPDRDLPCAKAIEQVLQPKLDALYKDSGTSAQIGIHALSSSYKSGRHVIELWLPPKRAPASKD